MGMLESKPLTIVIPRSKDIDVPPFFPDYLRFWHYPEHRLFPDDCAEIADKVMSRMKLCTESGQDLILVTWSEVLILRLVRMVVQGLIKNTDIVIYYIEKDNEPITISVLENGELSNWPKNLFSAAYDEVVGCRRDQTQSLRLRLAKAWKWVTQRDSDGTIIGVDRVSRSNPEDIGYRIFGGKGRGWSTWSVPAASHFDYDHSLARLKKKVEDEEVRLAMKEQ
jgi:hypothetical protein